jgi:alpha-glucosidase
MNKPFLYIYFTLLLLASYPAISQSVVPGSETTIESPDHQLVFKFYQKNNAENQKTFHYLVNYKGKEVIKESLMALELDNHLSESAMALKQDRHKNWFDNLKINGITKQTNDTSWTGVYGENSLIRDHYNSVNIETVKDDNPIYLMNIQVRVYNEGVAFRYYFPENEKGTYYRIMAEHTTFTFPENTVAWVAAWAQAPYVKLPLTDWKGEAERPLTLALPSGLAVSLVEAQMVDYARTKFKLSPSEPNTVVTSMFTPADLISPFGTPWRLIMIADNAAKLAGNSYMVLNLNAPSAIKKADWIKPGKIMRVMSQTTKDAFENIDFAVNRKLQYVLFDWKWYGPAFSFSSDATKVAIKDFDLPAIIKYGKERGVGVWLYVNQQALLAQSDSLFSTYK